LRGRRGERKERDAGLFSLSPKRRPRKKEKDAPILLGIRSWITPQKGWVAGTLIFYCPKVSGDSRRKKERYFLGFF